MLSYAVYSEAGGVGKTTLSYNLAKAHARAGLDVLVVPLDPQDGDLSYLAAVDDIRGDGQADNLVRHLIDMPEGPFEDLIVTSEGDIDIIPEHNMLSDLEDFLQREAEQHEQMGKSYPKYTQLFRLVREHNVPDKYDVLIVDPPASEGAQLYNAISATQNLVLPIEPSNKGEASVEGLEDLVSGLSEQLDIEVGVLAAVPNGVKGTNDQQDTIAEIRATDFDVPVILGDRASLFEGCWKQHCTAFEYVREHRTQKREYEIETLAKLDELARHIESIADIEAPDPPEPGTLEDDETIEEAAAEGV